MGRRAEAWSWTALDPRLEVGETPRFSHDATVFCQAIIGLRRIWSTFRRQSILWDPTAQLQTSRGSQRRHVELCLCKVWCVYAWTCSAHTPFFVCRSDRVTQRTTVGTVPFFFVTIDWGLVTKRKHQNKSWKKLSVFIYYFCNHIHGY